MPGHNMSWIQYPSHVSTAVEDIIAAQGLLARCIQVYMVLCIPLSLAAGLFNLATFIRRRDKLGSLDVLLLALTVTNLLATMLSFTVLSRPDYLAVTHLCCAALSFLANLCYFYSQYLQLAMLFLVLLPAPACRPTAALAALGGCALGSSLGVVSLLGMAGQLHAPTLCQVDPLTAWPEYEMVKFSLGFGLALLLELVLCALLAARLAQRVVRAPQATASARSVVLAVALIAFACRLFYNVALLQRARHKLQRALGSPWDELLVNLAELVLFGESCGSSLATLLLHTPCRLALCRAPGRLGQWCRGAGRQNGTALKRAEG
ncbi:uncharacterized protein LOC101543242 [Sorex araneus]|uniref:uncharacterized protein LOC101543242 n=1 Tax=Sorex araneus TaxID=42254 RepID=UPI002433B598|nr:uncharacterized protein LOC101543242 [Sorex araneus]